MGFGRGDCCSRREVERVMVFGHGRRLFGGSSLDNFTRMHDCTKGNEGAMSLLEAWTSVGKAFGMIVQPNHEIGSSGRHWSLFCWRGRIYPSTGKQTTGETERLPTALEQRPLRGA